MRWHAGRAPFTARPAGWQFQNLVVAGLRRAVPCPRCGTLREYCERCGYCRNRAARPSLARDDAPAEPALRRAARLASRGARQSRSTGPATW